ncbi:MAG: hypothetical protein WCY23_00815 [Candidatus Omnitrophota bacterium]
MKGLAAAAICTWALFYIVRRATPEEDRKPVSSLLAYSLALKLILFLVIQYAALSRGLLDIFGDAQDNIIKGILFGDYFRGKFDIGQVLSVGRYNTHSMSFFNGAYFAVFRDDIIFLKYINMLAVTAAGWLTYDFLRRAYSPLAGKIAAAIILFWPTIIIWSLTDLKEAHFIFCLIAAFWIILRLGEQKMRMPTRIIYLASFLIILIYAVFLKYKFMLPLVLLSSVSLCLYYILVKCRTGRIRGRVIFLGMLLLGIFLLKYHAPVVQKLKDYYSILFSYYRGSVSTAGWNYSLIPIGSPDMYTLGYFAKYLASGLFHFLAEPLPWRLYSYSMVIIGPFMLLWYTLLFYSAAGLVKLAKLHRTAAFIPMLVFAGLYAASLGMSVANIGTAVRFRDAIMPVAAMLASCAVCIPAAGKGRE